MDIAALSRFLYQAGSLKDPEVLGGGSLTERK